MKSQILGQMEVVLGVLPAAALGTPNLASADWIIETVDSDGSVGSYPSVAVDSGGNPHVAYYDYTSYRVKYAQRVGGIWQTEFISPLQGAYPSLALDTLGRPHISWSQWAYHWEPVMYTYWDGAQWVTQQLPYAICPGRNNHTALAVTAGGLPRIAVVPTGSETWTDRLEYLTWDGSVWARVQLTTGGAQSGDPTIVLDANDNPQIVWPCCYGGGAYLYYFWSDGAGWSSEAITSSLWLDVLYDPAAFALAADGTPYVAFQDSSTALNLGHRTGSGWQFDEIADCPGPAYQVSLALDACDYPHVAYHDPGDLRYAHRTTGAWCIQTADDPGTAHSSIAVDPNGNPHICYLDASNYDLKYARWDPSVTTGDLNGDGCVNFGDINPFVLYQSNIEI